MSRNELFLLFACAIIATVMSGGPAPLIRSSSLTIASLITPAAMDAASLDPAMFQRSLDHQ